MPKFKVVATGGTFDHLHKGHEALLRKSFEVGDVVIIGVSSDEFAKKQGKKIDFDYGKRVAELRKFIDTNFPGRKYEIAKLDDYFGPGISSPDVEAIVVSPETVKRVEIANELRREKGFGPLNVIVIDYVLAEDGKPISSTRIRNKEIDREGRLL